MHMGQDRLGLGCICPQCQGLQGGRVKVTTGVGDITGGPEGAGVVGIREGKRRVFGSAWGV